MPAFINIAGITLQYRVHGAYWVLVSNHDKENCGVIVKVR
jgi:hypothetical protein